MTMRDASSEREIPNAVVWGFSWERGNWKQTVPFFSPPHCAEAPPTSRSGSTGGSSVEDEFVVQRLVALQLVEDRHGDPLLDRVRRTYGSRHGRPSPRCSPVCRSGCRPV